jgi:hypothetical protein
LARRDSEQAGELQVQDASVHTFAGQKQGNVRLVQRVGLVQHHGVIAGEVIDLEKGVASYQAVYETIFRCEM